MSNFDVIIEISADSPPIKYEQEDRFLRVSKIFNTVLHYPANYGYIPKTLSTDGDPVDVLVVTRTPLQPQSIIECRAIGVLLVEDQDGEDPKVLAVPASTVTDQYEQLQTYENLDTFLLLQIEEFYQDYKKHHNDKWSKIKGWDSAEVANKIIIKSDKAYWNKVRPPRYQGSAGPSS